MNLHLIKHIEREGTCIYCGEPFDRKKWQSVFAQVNHYKCITCRCGKENCITVDFIGTGHDSWSGLEEKIAKNTSVKVVQKEIRILK